MDAFSLPPPSANFVTDGCCSGFGSLSICQYYLVFALAAGATDRDRHLHFLPRVDDGREDVDWLTAMSCRPRRRR